MTVNEDETIYAEMRLPSTLGGLLEVALDDVDKLSSEGHIRLNMNTWLESNSDDPAGACEACLAGAVMLSRTPETAALGALPAEWPESTANKLRALDFLRHFSVPGALMRMRGLRALDQELSNAASRVQRALEMQFGANPLADVQEPQGVPGESEDNYEEWWRRLLVLRDLLLKAGI